MDALVIKLKKELSAKDSLHMFLCVKEGLKLGCVMLPEYCDVIIVPDDIEVRIEDTEGNVVEGEIDNENN